jgi:hypothetical protein
LGAFREGRFFIKSMSENNKEIYQQIRMVGVLFMTPIVVGVWPVAGFFLGDFLRRHYHWPDYAALLFAGLGFLAGILELIALFKILPKDKKKDGTTLS